MSLSDADKDVASLQRDAFLFCLAQSGNITICCEFAGLEFGVIASWRDLPEQLQTGLLSMAFNLGGPRLQGFQKMRAAIRKGDFAQAADEALDSKWAKQVGRRADEIADGFRKAAKSAS